MSDDLYAMLSPLLVASGFELIDVEVHTTLVRVTVDREGGVDLDALAAANKLVSAALDEADPLPGRYTLEVSSPGVERRLRTPAHFQRAVGETVSLRTLPGTGDRRRVQGQLVEADDEAVVLAPEDAPESPVRIRYGAIERARTVFEWGPTPAPSPSRAKGGRPRGAKKDAKTERVTTP